MILFNLTEIIVQSITGNFYYYNFIDNNFKTIFNQNLSLY